MVPSGWKGFNSPFLPIILAFIAGIWVGDGIPMAISLASLGVILSLLLVLCRQNKKVGKLLGLALLFTLGALLIHLKLHPTLSPHHIGKIPERKERVLVGTIYRPPQKRGGKVVVYLLVEKIYKGDISVPSTGKVRITIRDPSLKLRYGYRVRLSAKLYRPRNFRNPGSFDYEGYLRRRGVLITGYVRGRDKVWIISKEGGNPLLRQFDRWREKIETFLDNNTFPFSFVITV